MEKIFVLVSEFLLGYLLQSIACVMWLTSFNKSDIKLKRFINLSLFLTVVTIIARLLPITFGIHTIIIIIAIILIGIWGFKFDVYRSVIIGSLAFFLIMICEAIVFISMYFIFLGEELANTFIKTNLFHNKTPGIIANVVFFLLVSIIYIIKDVKKIKKA